MIAMLEIWDVSLVFPKGNTGRIVQGIKTVLGELRLNLHEGKTKVVDARKESFNFLGFTIQVKENTATGKKFPLVTPSKKALQHIKTEIKNLTCRKNLPLPKKAVVNKINKVVRGWANYILLRQLQQ